MIAPNSTTCIPPLAVRAIQAARAVNTNQGHCTHRAEIGIPQAAVMHGVSDTSVERALVVIECISNEPLQQLESGQLSLFQAYAMAKSLGRRKVSRQRPAAAIWQIIVI